MLGGAELEQADQGGNKTRKGGLTRAYARPRSGPLVDPVSACAALACSSGAGFRAGGILTPRPLGSAWAGMPVHHLPMEGLGQAP